MRYNKFYYLFKKNVYTVFLLNKSYIIVKIFMGLLITFTFFGNVHISFFFKLTYYLFFILTEDIRR